MEKRLRDSPTKQFENSLHKMSVIAFFSLTNGGNCGITISERVDRGGTAAAREDWEEKT